MTPEAMKTPDPIDPLDSLLNRRSPVVVRPDFLDRVIAATVMEAQEQDEKIIEFPTTRRLWVRLGSVAAAAAVEVELSSKTRIRFEGAAAERATDRLLERIR